MPPTGVTPMGPTGNLSPCTRHDLAPPIVPFGSAWPSHPLFPLLLSPSCSYPHFSLGVIHKGRSQNTVKSTHPPSCPYWALSSPSVRTSSRMIPMPSVARFGLLLFNGTVSTNRLYRVIEVQSISRRVGEQHSHTPRQCKPRQEAQQMLTNARHAYHTWYHLKC